MKLKTLMVIGLVFMMTTTTKAQVAKYQAAYMYNFFSYVEWPSSYRNGDFIIGVLGSKDAVVKELLEIARAKKVISQRITVNTFNSVSEITKCHALFIPAAQSAYVAEAAEKIGTNSTLLISSTPTGIAQGAAINFLVVNSKLTFDLKTSNAKKYNINVSSSLNQLANKVH